MDATVIDVEPLLKNGIFALYNIRNPSESI